MTGGRLRFATPAQILAMAVAWSGVCLGIEFAFKADRVAETVEARTDIAPLSLRVNHPCGLGCLSEATEDLRSLPWLQDAPMAVRERGSPPDRADDASALADGGGWVDIQVADVNDIDFVAIDRTLHDGGFVASQMHFGGTRHFRLEATVRPLCCGPDESAAEGLRELARRREAGRLKWLDSVVADGASGRVTIHARYMEPTERIDATELIAAMDEIGLPPLSLKVVTGPEIEGLR